MVKSKFELIYGSMGEIYNILPLSRSTLTAYEISKEDYYFLMGSARTFSRTKNQIGVNIDKHFNEIVFVKMPQYPLPGFVTTKGVAVVNLESIAASQITDYSNADIYAMMLYSLSLKEFITKQSLSSEDFAEHVSAFLFSIFMKLYGKKSGLLGAYRNLIPNLRFLISYYVYVSMFGYSQTQELANKIGSLVYRDPKELNLNFNFSSTKGFLEAINENNIIPISENKFSTQIINIAGVTGLPLFEDLSRFFATLLAATVPGNSLFSRYWIKVRKELYNKLVHMGTITLNRTIK